MKKLITAVLTITLALSCTAIPMHQAFALTNGDTCSKHDNCTYKDGYWETYEYEDDGYSVMSLNEADEDENGTHGNNVGEIWYDKDGSVVYKEINNETLIDKRRINDAEVIFTGGYYDADISSSVVITGFSIEAKCYADGKEVEWSSSDTSVAIIDKNGKITGKKEGKVTIIATIKSNGQKVTKNLTVQRNQYHTFCIRTHRTFKLKESMTLSYDTDGNLKWKITLQNLGAKKFKYNRTTYKLKFKDNVIGKLKFKNTTVKPNKAKSKTCIIKKKNVKGLNLKISHDFSCL